MVCEIALPAARRWTELQSGVKEQIMAYNNDRRMMRTVYVQVRRKGH